MFFNLDLTTFIPRIAVIIPNRKHPKINLIQIAKGIGINGPDNYRGWVGGKLLGKYFYTYFAMNLTLEE
jgi:hypothetical protein